MAATSMITDDEMMKHGEHLFTVAGPRSHTLNDWCELLAKTLAEPPAGIAPIRVDWRLVGGRACFLFLVGSGKKRRELTGNERGHVREVSELLLGDRLRQMYMECEDNFTTNPEPRDVQYLWVG